MLLLLLLQKKFTINAKTIDGHLKRRISQNVASLKWFSLPLVLRQIFTRRVLVYFFLPCSFFFFSHQIFQPFHGSRDRPSCTNVSISPLEGPRLIPDHKVFNVFLVIIAFVDLTCYCIETDNRQTRFIAYSVVYLLVLLSLLLSAVTESQVKQINQKS